jgi:large subunit ribosomal protein L9
VEGRGEPGTVVTVARGYMRNYLLPRGMAEVATPARIAEVQRREQERRAAEIRAVEQSKELVDLLSRTILTLKAKAGDDGRLFGSITSADVATAIKEARGVTVDRRTITVEPPIRAVGTYSVPIELAPGLTTEVKTIVSPLID